MTTIRIGAETHDQLKNLAKKQGSKLTELLGEITSLLVNYQATPSELEARLQAAEQLASLQKMLTEQVARFMKVLGEQERNYLFPLSKELAQIKEHTEQLAGREDVISLVDIDERLGHIAQLIQENKAALDKQYQLLMEV